jgi:hypothetical protein
MENMTVFGNEKAEGDVPGDVFTTSIIKVACILIIGVAILSSVVTSTNITCDSVFYGLMENVKGNIQSGYTLAALMVLSLGAGSILYFLGFV